VITRHHRIAFLLLSVWTGCSLASAASAGKSESTHAEKTELPADSARDYVLKPQDLLRVYVSGEDNINKAGDIRISQQYTVTLPLIGTIELKDKTVRQAEEYIRKLYDADFIVNPQVVVTVVEYAPISVAVVGAVTTQGTIFFPKEGGLTLLDAIAKAGGFNRYANMKAVTLKRTLPDGKVRTEKIDVDELMKGKTADTWPLQPGDVISVPEKVL
jgi:polysaccharide export outer membrane protein